MNLSRTLSILALCAAPLAAACEATSGAEVVLPAGDVDAGRETFLAFACNDCHSVVGRPELREGVTPFMTVALGGPTDHIRTQAELITSIVNPSHRISERYRPDPDGRFGDAASPMANYNDLLIVTDLIDLVAFLQSEYTSLDVPPPDFTPYQYPDPSNAD